MSRSHAAAATPLLAWLDSLTEIEATQWDATATSVGFYSSHLWLRGYEADPNSKARYLTITDSGAELLAAIPAYTVTHERNRRYRLDGLDLKPASAALPQVFCSRRGYQAGVLISPALTEEARAEALELMRAALAAEEDACSPVWFYVPDRLIEDVLTCCVAPRKVKIDVDAAVEVPPGGFEEYAARLPTHRRGHVRAERRRFLRAGYDVAIEPLLAIADEAAPLLAQLEWKYGSSNPLEHYLHYVHRLASADDPGIALTCRRRGKLVAFCHCYLFGGTTWLRIGGFDYPQLQNAYEYFNMAFFELIEFSAQRGCTRLHLGMGSLEAKVNHGAATEDLWLVEFDRRRSPLSA
jgi:uncharacterized protein